MYLTLKDYKILSDFYFYNSNNPLLAKASLIGYKNADDLHQKTGELLDRLKDEHIALSRKTTTKILEKRRSNKERARDLAIEWQSNFANQPRSWAYCIEWGARWERIGRKYRLLREFKENGII